MKGYKKILPFKSTAKRSVTTLYLKKMKKKLKDVSKSHKGNGKQPKGRKKNNAIKIKM